MEKPKTNKKALKSLINDSMRDAIGRLELPEPSKKVEKLLYRNAKKLASAYADILKREEKKKRKASKVEATGTKSKKKKEKKIKLEAVGT